MTRLRITGIVWIVTALAGLSVGASVVTAQTKSPVSPVTQSPKQMPKAVKLKPIDINLASEEDFVLVGIDRPSAKKIVQARPYRSKFELVSRQLLTRDQYDKVKDSLVAKQPAKKK